MLSHWLHGSLSWKADINNAGVQLTNPSLILDPSFYVISAKHIQSVSLLFSNFCKLVHRNSQKYIAIVILNLVRGY